jgi:hypothetical protein
MMQTLPNQDFVELQNPKVAKKKHLHADDDPNFKKMLDEVSRNFGFKESYTSVHQQRMKIKSKMSSLQGRPTISGI